MSSDTMTFYEPQILHIFQKCPIINNKFFCLIECGKHIAETTIITEKI